MIRARLLAYIFITVLPMVLIALRTRKCKKLNINREQGMVNMPEQFLERLDLLQETQDVTEIHEHLAQMAELIRILN